MLTKHQCFFLTGGRGRLASLISGHFGLQGHPVTAYSRTEDAGRLGLGRLLQPGALDGADILLHLAWSCLPAQAEQQPDSARQHDLPLLAQMLDAVAAQPADRRPHFVFFSSGGAVYGNAPGRPSREDDVCRPIGEYGRAKVAAEQLITERSARDGLACAILRVSNPYGYPVPTERQQGLIPHAIRCARSGQPLALWGDGSARKDFIHCSDLLAGLELAVSRRLTGVFNLCAGESHTVHEVLAMVEREVGRKIPLAQAPAPAWDVHDSRLENTRLVAATGWQPRISLAAGIREAVVHPFMA